MGINIETTAGLVIGSSGGASVKHLFRIDTNTYSWVKDYVRDKKIRSEIKRLQDEIAKTNALPIHKDELRRRFEGRIEQINKSRIQQMITHLDGVQKRENPLINELMINAWKLNDALFNPVLINLAAIDIDEIFSELQDGVPQKEIDETVKQLQDKIVKLEKVIEQELSPQQRWFFRDNGDPEPYPQGCRWTPFVQTWEKVVSKFSGKVDIEGCALTSSDELAAFGLLELDRVAKRPPLRDPLE
jgi:hypothetical protein